MAVVTAVLITTVLAIYSQQAFGKDDPNAQPPKGPGDKGERVEKRMQHLTKELNLTKEQQEKIRPIIEKEMKDIRDVRENTSLTQEQKMEKIKVIHQGTQAEVNKILTPEQQKKYAEMQEKAREEMAEHKAEHNKNRQHEPEDSNSK